MKLRSWLRYVRKAFETWQVIARDYGWRQSFLEGRPLDAAGQAIPWYTYPAIEFLRTLDFRHQRILEFGCGNSSFFWAERAREVVAIENDIEWAKRVAGAGVPNLKIVAEPDRARYIAAPEQVGGTFGVVVIDGRFRQACVAVACRVIDDAGMIVFDNADWYPQACAELRAQGWFQIDFSGLGPINPYCWTTSVFLRSVPALARRPSVAPIGGTVQ